MKTILCSTLLIALTVLASSGDEPVSGGSRVDYSVDLTQVRAQPTKPSASPLLSKRIPGAGRILKEWRIVRLGKHVYELSGTVHSDNAYFPSEDAPVLIGNIAVIDMLRIVAKTDVKGRFKVILDNRTAADRQEEMKNAGLIVLVEADTKSPEDQEAIYLRNKYLYLGTSNVDLYRYEIPYKEAEQASTGQPATRLESKSEGSDKPQPESEGRSR